MVVSALCTLLSPTPGGHRKTEEKKVAHQELIHTLTLAISQNQNSNGKKLGKILKFSHFSLRTPVKNGGGVSEENSSVAARRRRRRRRGPRREDRSTWSQQTWKHSSQVLGILELTNPHQAAHNGRESESWPNSPRQDSLASPSEKSGAHVRSVPTALIGPSPV